MRIVWLVVILAVAVVLRVLAALDDPWLDEVWSWHLVQESKSAWAAITNRHDNNHIFNTAVLCLLGDCETWLPYRIPAIVAGLLSVGMSFVIGRRMTSSSEGGLIVASVFAASFFHVVYASEARGYAYAILFALASWWALDHALRKGTLTWQLLFGVFVALGFCAHLGFLHFYAAAGVWSLVHVWLQRREAKAFVLTLLRLHAVPTAFFGLLALFFVKGIVHGGAPGQRMQDLLHDTFAWTFGIVGLPGDGGLTVGVGALLLVALLVWEFRRSRGDRDTSGVFMLGVMTIAPIMTIALSMVDKSLPLPYPRYFTISITFLVLLVGRALATMFVRGGGLRAASMLLLALFVAGNLLHTAWLIQSTRGDYSRVVALLQAEAQKTTKKPLVFTGHPFRSTMMNHWFLRNEPGLRCAIGRELAGARVDACVFEHQARHPKPGQGFRLGNILRAWYGAPPQAPLPPGWPDNVMQKVAEVDYYGPSGFRWMIYRRKRR